MKKIPILLLLSLFFMYDLSAQRSCATMEHQHEMEIANPGLKKSRQKAEKNLQNFIKNHQESRGGGQEILTIPTVVHVIYSNATQNISDAQVLSQIQVLNEDFRLLNADTSNIPAGFRPDINDSGIEFCMATRDPEGNPTDGITRTQTNTNSFGTNDNMKFDASGGKDAWPTDEYLNVWVCNLSGGLLGYAQFPGGAANTDGVAIGYNYFGNQGQVSSPFDLGRTTTHEVGHWLSLFHIWGDDGSACTGSDNAADTPNQAGASGGCPTFPKLDACTGASPGVMFMNYMDYSDDACMNSFTNDQNTRMRNTLQSQRASLLENGKCLPIELPAIDAAITTIVSPSGTFCGDSFTPEIVLRNLGSDPLTSANINIQVDGGTVVTEAWSGNIASLMTENVTMASISVVPGPHLVEVYVSDPNSGMDADAGNDGSQTNITVNSGTGGLVGPFVEGFEGTFPPSGWTLNNPDASYTFEQTSDAASAGSNSILIDNYNYSANGEIDELILPDMDYTTAIDPALYFDLAYALYSTSGFSDTLRVMVSTDCGDTWNMEWEKYDAALSTIADITTEDFFVPLEDEWRTETVDLTSYAGMSGVQIMFRHITDYENALYLDNVNLGTYVHNDNMVQREALKIYPNPVQNILNVSFDFESSEDYVMTVTDIHGKLIKSNNYTSLQKGNIQLDLNDYPNGIYFVRMTSSEKEFNKKFSIIK